MFSWTHLGLVVLGGALGTAARAGLGLAGGDLLGVLFVPLVNLVGAFALGCLTGMLLGRADTPRARALRQFFGAGVLGGFTTYSALALESAGSLGMVLVGLAAAAAGTLAAVAGLALTTRRSTS